MSEIVYRNPHADKKMEKVVTKDVTAVITCLVPCKHDCETIAFPVPNMDVLLGGMPAEVESDGVVFPAKRVLAGGLSIYSSSLHPVALAVLSRSQDGEGPCLPEAAANFVDGWAAREFSGNKQARAKWASPDVGIAVERLLAELNGREAQQVEQTSGGSPGTSCAPVSSLVLGQTLQEPADWQESLRREVGSVLAVKALGRNGPSVQRQRHITETGLLIAERIAEFARGDEQLTEDRVTKLEELACSAVNSLAASLFQQLGPSVGLAMALERSDSATGLFAVVANQDDLFGVDRCYGIDLEQPSKSRETRTAPTYYFIHDHIKLEEETKVRELAKELQRRGLIGVIAAEQCNAVLLNAMRENDDPVWDHLVAVEGRVVVSPARRLGASELAELTLPATYALQAAITRAAFDTSHSGCITSTPRHPKSDRLNGLIVKGGVAGDGQLLSAARLDVINGHVHITGVPSLRLGGRQAREVVADQLTRRLLRHFVVEVASPEELEDLPVLLRRVNQYLRQYTKGEKPWFKNVNVQGVRTVDGQGLVFNFDVVVSLRDEPKGWKVSIHIDAA